MSTSGSPPGKRVRLVEAALRVFHEQGYTRSTLADVAAASGVPLGNIHYYFKSKESLALEVVARHVRDLNEVFAVWERDVPDPLARLSRLTGSPLASADSVVRWGCPHGGLCQELNKLSGSPALDAASERLMETYLSWAERQWLACGCAAADARARAEDLVASLQGAMLLAHTTGSVSPLINLARRWGGQEASA